MNAHSTIRSLLLILSLEWFCSTISASEQGGGKREGGERGVLTKSASIFINLKQREKNSGERQSDLNISPVAEITTIRLLLLPLEMFMPITSSMYEILLL